MKEMGYPYRVAAHRTRIGDGSMDYVFFLDGIDSFYAEETWEDLIEANGLTEMHAALQAKHGELVKRYQTMHSRYQPDMSYWPTDG